MPAALDGEWQAASYPLYYGFVSTRMQLPIIRIQMLILMGSLLFIGCSKQDGVLVITPTSLPTQTQPRVGDDPDPATDPAEMPPSSALTSTPRNAEVQPVSVGTATDLPEDRSVGWNSPDGNWIVHEMLSGGEAQIISQDGKIKWIIHHSEVDFSNGTDINTWHFFEHAVYFGIFRANYETELLQRIPPVYRVFRLDLTDGSIDLILESEILGGSFPGYTYFEISPDEAEVVYSRWLSQAVVIRDISSGEESEMMLPKEYRIAGGFLWSPDKQSIIFTMWQDEFETPTTFAIAELDVGATAIRPIFVGSESDYLLVAYDWLDDKSEVLLQDRRLGEWWRLNLETAEVVAY